MSPNMLVLTFLVEELLWPPSGSILKPAPYCNIIALSPKLQKYSKLNRMKGSAWKID